MRITHLLTAVFALFFFSSTASAQENNCDVRQLQAGIYDFVLKNQDSIKKYHKTLTQVTASLELGDRGEVKSIAYFTGYGEKNQKKIKLWKGLESFVKESFSRCPDSHFYNVDSHVTASVFAIPFTKEGLEKAKKELLSGAGYIAAGTGQKDIDKNSKYTIEVKSFKVGLKTNEPLKKEGMLDYNRSKMIKLSDLFHIAFELVKLPGGKTTFFQYKLYERVDNKGVIITTENWRPVVNGKVNLLVKGIRDTHPGVKHVKVGEEFEFEIEVTFHN